MPSSQTPAPFLGVTGPATQVIPVTFTLDNGVAYASGDLLANPVAVAAALRGPGRTAKLTSLTINDKDDQGVAFTVVVMKASTSLGTLNVAPSAADAVGDDVLGIIPVAAADWVDFGGFRIASLRNLGLPLIGGSNTGATARNIWLALINGAGTPTFTTNGLTALVGIDWS